MYPEYGIPLAHVAYAIGHAVWLRMAAGPQLVTVTDHQGGRVEVTPSYPDAMPMIVPAERLAWNYAEAIA